MLCSKCKVDKLSSEYPQGPLTKQCDHASSICLRCILQIFDEQKEPGPSNAQPEPASDPIFECPDCKSQIQGHELEAIKLYWNNASFKLDIDKIVHIQGTDSNSLSDDPNNAKFYVVLLNGDKITIDLAKVSTVNALRSAIQNQLRVEIHRQKLIYNGQELIDLQADRTTSKLADYGIANGSCVQLIVILYSITNAEALRSLVFELNWGYPDKGIDYLDGSCIVYESEIPARKYDYMSVFYPPFPYMRHSGDIMDNSANKGNHRITANLQELPKEVTQLYFVLSAFNVNTIGQFKDPSFRLYDEAATSDKQQLCTYTISNAADSQAVIMCCVSRTGDDMWQVMEIGKLTAGNANDYDLIQASIQELGLFLSS